MTKTNLALAGGFNGAGGDGDEPRNPGLGLYNKHRKKSKPHTAIADEGGLYGSCEQDGEFGKRQIREYAHLYMLREQTTWAGWSDAALQEIKDFAKKSELKVLSTKHGEGPGITLHNALFDHLLKLDGGIPTRGVDRVNFKPKFAEVLKAWVNNLPDIAEIVVYPSFGKK